MADTSLTTSEMASLSKFSYHRLRYHREFDEEADQERAFRKTRKSYRLRKFNVRKPTKLWIPGLRRLLRKRARFFSRVNVSWKKALKRLKNGQAHINDLFGGNYLQVNSNPLRCGGMPIVGHGLHGLPSRCSLRKIA